MNRMTAITVVRRVVKAHLISSKFVPEGNQNAESGYVLQPVMILLNTSTSLQTTSKIISVPTTMFSKLGV